jgi:hypothetical protein
VEELIQSRNATYFMLYVDCERRIIAVMSKNRTGRPMSGGRKLSSFVASVATKVRATIEVGIPVDDTGTGAPGADEREPTRGLSDAQLWDDAPGRMTRNGLGSLEIGAGKTRVDE